MIWDSSDRRRVERPRTHQRCRSARRCRRCLSCCRVTAYHGALPGVPALVCSGAPRVECTPIPTECLSVVQTDLLYWDASGRLLYRPRLERVATLRSILLPCIKQQRYDGTRAALSTLSPANAPCGVPVSSGASTASRVPCITSAEGGGEGGQKLLVPRFMAPARGLVHACPLVCRLEA
jgi:hypothetical protein